MSILEEDAILSAQLHDSITSISENTEILSENEHSLINDIILNYDIESANEEEVDSLLNIYDHVLTMESNFEENISVSEKAAQLEGFQSLLDKAAENVENGESLHEEFENYSTTTLVGFGEDLTGESAGANSIEIFFPDANIFGEGVEVSAVAVDYDENPFYLNEVTTNENGDVTTQTLGEAIQFQLQLDGETFEPILLDEPMLIIFENIIEMVEEYSNRRLLSAEVLDAQLTCMRYGTDTGMYTSDDMITGEYDEENDTLECYVEKLYPFSLFSLSIEKTEYAEYAEPEISEIPEILEEDSLEYTITNICNFLKDSPYNFRFLYISWNHTFCNIILYYLQTR